MGHDGKRSSGGSSVSDPLGKEMVAAPTVARMRRRRLELPQAIRPERMAFGERPYERLPLAVDFAMLLLASVGARVLSLATKRTLSPVAWDGLSIPLVTVGFGPPGSY